jgi:hypothetical protein
MSEGRGKRKSRLTDAQIEERVGNMLSQPPKTSHLTSAVFVMTFLALTLRFAVPPGFTRRGGLWGLFLWIINLLWTLLAVVGWKPLPAEGVNRVPKGDWRRQSRLETIWFHFWKGGYLLLVSASMLLIGLGMFSYPMLVGWVTGLAVAGYLMAFVLSFWHRRRILRVKVERWLVDIREGRLMLRLAIVGPVVGASIGSAIGIILVRLGLLPVNILVASAGFVGILVADMIAPAVVQDFAVAHIHWRARQAEIERA